jgi:hypothetical protein
MATLRRIDMELVARTQTAAQDTTTDAETLRQAQAVLLPALFRATLEHSSRTGSGTSQRGPTPGMVLRRQGRGDVRVEPN